MDTNSIGTPAGRLDSMAKQDLSWMSASNTVQVDEAECPYGDADTSLSEPPAAEQDTLQLLPEASQTALLGRGIWTLAGYGLSTSVRFASNVVLARLLAPQIFGVMVVVSSLRIGIELLTDVGIEQNIIHNDKGLEDEFFNTAWTLQMLRGGLLTLLFIALSTPLARFYGIDVRVFLAVSLIPFLNSLHSTSVFGLTKSLEVKRRNLFECGSELLGFIACVALALITPTVWALVGGALLATAARSALSYWLPHPPHRLVLNKACVHEIVRFGKWIFLSSFAVYGAGNIDRLTLGKLAPFALLGVYGIARTIAEIPATLATRLGYQIVFPFMASQSGLNARRTHRDLGAARFKICLGGSLFVSFAITWADRAVSAVYDARYHQAGWILSLLLFGTWVAILSNLNESVLIGCGRPSYSAVANGVRLAAIGASLPLCYTDYGIAGAIAVVVAGELIRYSILAVGQHRLRWSYYRQDALCSIALLLGIAFWLVIRNRAGMGMPWDQATVSGHPIFMHGGLK